MMSTETTQARPSVVLTFLPIGIGIAIGIYYGPNWLRLSAGAAAAFALIHILFQSWHYRQFMTTGGRSNLWYFGMRFVVELLKVGIPAFVAMTISRPDEIAQSLTPWPEGARQAYVQRCNAELVSQGLSPARAQGACVCVAEGLESNFGLEEYSLMIAAQPNERGNSVERRLFSVLERCLAQRQ